MDESSDIPVTSLCLHSHAPFEKIIDVKVVRMNLPSKMLTILEAVAGIQSCRSEEETLITSVVKLEEMGYPLVMLSLVQEIDGKRFVVARPDRATGPKWALAAEITKRQLDGGTDLLARILQRQRSRFVANSQADPLKENDEALCKRIGLVSQYAIPIFTGSLLIGTIQLDLGIIDSFPEDEAAMLDAFAAHLALAIDRQRNISNRERIHNKLFSHASLISFEMGAATILHDLNSNITLYSTQLSAALKDQRIRVNSHALAFLEQTQANVNKWLTEIKASIATVRSTEPPTLIPVDSFIPPIIDHWYASCRQKDIKLTFDAGAPTVTVRGVAASLVHAVTCLIANAIDANPRTIKIATQRVNRANIDGYMVDHAQITILDDGRGFPAKDSDRIGTLGWTTKGKKGHGMGLMLVELIVTQVGGKFLIKKYGKSAGDAETEIVIWIPVSRNASTTN